MADTVNINYQEMAAIAKKFSQQQQQIVNMERRLKSAVQSLHNQGWIGLGSDSFFREMEDKVLPGVDRLQAALAEASQETNKISKMLTEAEQGAAGLFPREA